MPWTGARNSGQLSPSHTLAHSLLTGAEQITQAQIIGFDSTIRQQSFHRVTQTHMAMPTRLQAYNSSIYESTKHE